MNENTTRNFYFDHILPQDRGQNKYNKCTWSYHNKVVSSEIVENVRHKVHY